MSHVDQKLWEMIIKPGWNGDWEDLHFTLDGIYDDDTGDQCGVEVEVQKPDERHYVIEKGEFVTNEASDEWIYKYITRIKNSKVREIAEEFNIIAGATF